MSIAVTAHNRRAVLTVYRSLLRSTFIAFGRKDDVTTLQAARQHARQEFNKGRKFQAGSVEAQQGIEHAKGVAQILRENVVQGVRESPGENIKLNIHEHTERGDNETIRKLKGTSKSFKDMKD